MKTNTYLQPPAHLLAIASIVVAKLLSHAQLLDRNNQPIHHNEPQQRAPQCQDHENGSVTSNRDGVSIGFVDVRACRNALMVALININATPITATPTHRNTVGNTIAPGHSQATTNANPPRPNRHASGT